MKCTTLSALAFGLLSLLGAHAVSATTVSAPFKTVTIGQTFSVEISITDAAALESFQFDLGFAPSIVAASEAGATTPLAGWSILSSGLVDNTGGNILGVAAAGPAFSGNGAIARLQFTALALGTSPLDLTNVFVNFLDSGFTVLDGQIAVVIPEPTTVALLASGLLLIAARRRLTSRIRR